jgi:DNA-binding SARP family transcriptional activator
MSGLELKFLGDFEVRRGGRPLPLPPSKKTRALLAWLGLNERRFRREQLCELLWQIPDDPRGSLRWSLSKLRRLVGELVRRLGVYRAPDAESVRLAQREARMPVEKVWSFRRYGPEPSGD